MYCAIRPPPELEGIVDAFWRFDAAGFPHRVVPDGCMDLLFDLDDTRGALVVGPMARAKVVHLPRGARVFGVRFRPGAGALFIDAPAQELRDQDCPVDDITRARRFRLTDRVLGGRSDGDRCAVIAAFLTDPARRVRASDARIRRAVDLIEDSNGASPMAEIAAQTAISERQLLRLFRERVGLVPKLFARIARIRYAGELQKRGEERHAALAIRAGYADQAHFVRECRSLFGVTPTVIARERHVGFVQSERRGAG